MKGLESKIDDIFLEDRRVEKETYAIIHYFQLLEKVLFIQEALCPDPNESFLLIDGPKSFQNLVIDCKEGYINIFENNISDLLKILKENIFKLDDITFSNSLLKEEALQLAKSILNRYHHYLVEKNYIQDSAYFELCSFSILQKYMEKLTFLPSKQKSKRKII